MQVHHELLELEEEEKGRKVVQEIERESQLQKKRSHGHDYGDDMKDSNILSHGACADDVILWTRGK